MSLLVSYLVRVWHIKTGEFAAGCHKFYTLEDAEKKADHLFKLGYGKRNTAIKIFKQYERELIKTISDTKERGEDE